MVIAWCFSLSGGKREEKRRKLGVGILHRLNKGDEKMAKLRFWSLKMKLLPPTIYKIGWRIQAMMLLQSPLSAHHRILVVKKYFLSFFLSFNLKRYYYLLKDENRLRIHLLPTTVWNSHLYRPSHSRASNGEPQIGNESSYREGGVTIQAGAIWGGTMLG